MAFNYGEYQKTTKFPEEGTPDFMVVMGQSLKAYDAALDVLIDAMKLIRDSFMEMIEIHYGLGEYEEFLKDNYAASKVKVMHPDIVGRPDSSGQEQPEDQEKLREAKEGQDPQMSQDGQMELPDSFQHGDNRISQNQEEFFEEQAGDAYVTDPAEILEDTSRHEEKRRGR